MSRKIRLGPIAVFLAVVAVVLSTMAVLTTSTAHADRVLAQRFAAVTRDRYAIEAEGEKFLMACEEDAADGKIDADALGVKKTDGGYSKEIQGDGCSLKITLSEPDQSGRCEIVEWRISRQWNADDPLQNIWKGE